MKPHELRVVQEYQELLTKADSLRTFLSVDRPQYVSELQWDLMVQQYGLMIGYARVLNERIEDFEAPTIKHQQDS